MSAARGHRSYYPWHTLPETFGREGISSAPWQRALTYVAAVLAEGPAGLQAVREGSAAAGPVRPAHGHHHPGEATEYFHGAVDAFHYTEQIVAAMPSEAAHAVAHGMHATVDALADPAVGGPVAAVTGAALAIEAGAHYQALYAAGAAAQWSRGRNVQGGALSGRQVSSDVQATLSAIRTDPACAGVDLQASDLSVLERTFRRFDPDNAADVSNLASMFADRSSAPAAGAGMPVNVLDGVAPAQSMFGGSQLGTGPRLGDGSTKVIGQSGTRTRTAAVLGG